MNFNSDDEIANDEENDLNRVDGVVERQITTLKTNGFSSRELNDFERSLKGTNNHNFFRKF